MRQRVRRLVACLLLTMAMICEAFTVSIYLLVGLEEEHSNYLKCSLSFCSAVAGGSVGDAKKRRKKASSTVTRSRATRKFYNNSPASATSSVSEREWITTLAEWRVSGSNLDYRSENS